MTKTREAVLETIRVYENNSSNLGKLLYDIKENKSFKDWGHKTFEEYVRSEVGMDLRRAYYHISIWKVFGIGLGLSDEQIKRLGWTKAGCLTTLVKCGIINKANIAEWITKAEKLTTKQLNVEAQKVKSDSTTKGHKTSDIPVTSFIEMEPTVDGISEVL